MKYLATLIWISCLLSLNSCNDEVCSDLETRLNFLGVYSGTLSCDDGSSLPTPWEISTHPDGFIKLKVGLLDADITGPDSFLIPVQTTISQGEIAEYSGTATVKDDVLTMNLTFKNSNGTYQCQFTGKK